MFDTLVWCLLHRLQNCYPGTVWDLGCTLVRSISTGWMPGAWLINQYNKIRSQYLSSWIYLFTVKFDDDTNSRLFTSACDRYSSGRFLFSDRIVYENAFYFKTARKSPAISRLFTVTCTVTNMWRSCGWITPVVYIAPSYFPAVYDNFL